MRIARLTLSLVVLAILLASCSSASTDPTKKADAVGTCNVGALFIVPNKVVRGQHVQATSPAKCTPGRYQVDVVEVGAFSNAIVMGTMTADSTGTISGVLEIPRQIPLGYARAYVVANYSCGINRSVCSTGIAGTLTIT